ncbi:hypothetical protein ACJJTC_002733 [Scirpophaga incertulas]
MNKCKGLRTIDDGIKANLTSCTQQMKLWRFPRIQWQRSVVGDGLKHSPATKRRRSRKRRAPAQPAQEPQPAPTTSSSRPQPQQPEQPQPQAPAATTAATRKTKPLKTRPVPAPRGEYPLAIHILPNPRTHTSLRVAKMLLKRTSPDQFPRPYSKGREEYRE